MVAQATPPGTEAVIGSYSCAHDRTHQIPSDDVTIYRMGGAGFIAGCECGSSPIDHDSAGVFLGDHIVLLGGRNLDSRSWLALDERAEWFPGENPDCEPPGGGDTSRERRDNHRSEVHSQIDK
jgi:uncharacterized protein (DUF779 family)